MSRIWSHGQCQSRPLQCALGETYIQRDGYADYYEVVFVENVVLCQPARHQLGLDKPHKVRVERHVDARKNGLFRAVPDVVHADKCVVDLQPRGDPDAEDADVDEADGDQQAHLQPPFLDWVVHDEGQSVGQDLHQALDLLPAIVSVDRS